MDAPRHAVISGDAGRIETTALRPLLPLDRIGRAGFTLGAALIVVGGLVAAVTGPLDLAKGSWLAAYLVLVAGAAQCCLAVQGRVLAVTDASTGRLRAILAGWNAGNALVVIGTLAATPVVVDVGGILLVAALITAVAATRRPDPRARTAAIIFRAVLGLLIVSVPIGMVLAHVRAAA